VVRFALEKAGFDIIEAGDGQKALGLFQRTKPALIILDITMPEMDGLAVCREIRKTSDLPILFLSSRTDEVDRVVGLEIGGDDYVSKPFSPRELVARVQAILKSLLREPQRVFSRDRLMDAAYDGQVSVSDRTIDSHMRNLRAKYAKAGCKDLIETVHGVGYKLGPCR